MKEKEKRKLKKSAAPVKPQKHTKKQPAEEDAEDGPELELEPEEPEDDEEPEELEPDEESEDEGAEPASKNGKAGARPKGRPSKRPLIVDDEFEEDGVPDADEVGEELIIIPRKPKSKRGGADTSESGGGKNGEDANKPQTRLGLIRTRHDAMRREIDQIREDLESDEEE